MNRTALALAVLMLIALFARANAESTGWLNREDFRVSVYTLTEQGMVPGNIAARIQNGQPQFKAAWKPYPGIEHHIGFALYPLESREDAVIAIQGHENVGNNIEVDELCLAKFATAAEGGVEAWLVLLQETDAPGVRCIQLPAKP